MKKDKPKFRGKMKTSIASLKERLANWVEWDIASYQLGACLGFWPEYGAPYDNDPWHGVKGVIWSGNIISNAIAQFLDALVEEGCLQRRDEPDTSFRWNPNYNGRADIFNYEPVAK